MAERTKKLVAFAPAQKHFVIQKIYEELANAILDLSKYLKRSFIDELYEQFKNGIDKPTLTSALEFYKTCGFEDGKKIAITGAADKLLAKLESIEDFDSNLLKQKFAAAKASRCQSL